MGDLLVHYRKHKEVKQWVKQLSLCLMD
jgi:hypothetical protein